MADKRYVMWRRDRVLAVVAEFPYSTHKQIVDELKKNTVRYVYDFAYNDLSWLQKAGRITKHNAAGQVVYHLSPSEESRRSDELAMLEALI